MKNIVASAALAASFLSTAVAAECASVLTPDYQSPNVASGWAAQLIVRDLKKPRSIAFDTAGNLVVVESGKGISRLTFKDNGGTCLEVDRNILVIENTELNHGLAFSDDGKTLYASTVENVFAWSYDAITGTVGNVKTVVNKMSNNALVTRTLLMSKKFPGKLVVSRGADENNDVDAMDINTGLSQIRMFDLNNPPSSGTFDFNTEGAVLGWGLRNAVGIAEEPTKGGLYSVEASIDDITRAGTDIHQNNPGEELNYHGTLDVNSSYVGPNYGYPVCFALWDPSIPQQGDLKVGDQFAFDPANDTICNSNYQSPRLTFLAHTSPLNILFSDDGKEAYFAFHGSFNRDNPVGYTLSVAEFEDGEPVAASDSRDALTNIMSNPIQSECPDNCFRPVGLAWDGLGRLWMTSDSTGEIYVLERGGSSTGTPVSTPTPSPTNGGSAASREMTALVFAGAAAFLTAWLMV